MNNPYDCNIVLDLEFTRVPKKRRIDGLVTEIIEVGAVKVGPDRTIMGEFDRMVKPTMAEGVSGAVHWMTGIGDEDLTAAHTIDKVLEELVAWIGEGRARFVTWSGSDQKQIRSELAAKRIEMRLPGRWLDIQRLYPRLMGTEKRLVTLGDAADWCGIPNDKASAHRALYDAKMTAEIFIMMASGELTSHRKRLAAELDNKGRNAFGSSIADRCGNLAELRARLMAQESAGTQR